MLVNYLNVLWEGPGVFCHYGGLTFSMVSDIHRSETVVCQISSTADKYFHPADHILPSSSWWEISVKPFVLFLFLKKNTIFFTCGGIRWCQMKAKIAKLIQILLLGYWLEGAWRKARFLRTRGRGTRNFPKWVTHSARDAPFTFLVKTFQVWPHEKHLKRHSALPASLDLCRWTWNGTFLPGAGAEQSRRQEWQA